MSTFLSNMSHELRTPMHAILSYARLGQDRISRGLPEKTQQYLDRIEQSDTPLRPELMAGAWDCLGRVEFLAIAYDLPGRGRGRGSAMVACWRVAASFKLQGPWYLFQGFDNFPFPLQSNQCNIYKERDIGLPVTFQA